MKRPIFISTIVMTFLTACTQVSAQGIEALSSWKNQDGSVLTIENFGSDGSFTGSYVNHAPGYNCQGTPYSVSGWSNGSSITFAVNWDNPTENCNSVTGWTGYYANGVITTDWNLAVSGQQTINSGQDIFSYLSKAESGSLMTR